MDKQIRPKGGPALIITFYISTAALCILAAFLFSGDGRYYSPSGDFSIQLPGQWATLPVSFPDNEFSIFPQLEDPDGEQLSLASVYGSFNMSMPFLVSVRRIPKEKIRLLLGRDSGLKEFWQYLEDYQLSAPIAPALEGFSNLEPDYVRSDLMEISSYWTDFMAIMRTIIPDCQQNLKVTETRCYTISQWQEPYIFQISAMETADSYYILVAYGESDLTDISPDDLKEALSTITP